MIDLSLHPLQPSLASGSRWHINHEGWLPAAHHNPSPNYDARPPQTIPTLLVIHAISLPPETFGGKDIDALFLNTLDGTAHPYYEGIAHLRVSAHFLIRRNGELMQYVSTEQRAWHAGISSWNQKERCNDFSIGIELEGCDSQPFEGVQYPILVQLTRAIAAKYPMEAIVGHSDIAPQRKTDPGPHFDWLRYQKLLLPT